MSVPIDHDQRRPAHPARLHQRRHVDRLAPGRALPDIFQQPALAPQAPAERGIQRRPVQMPEGAFEHRGLQAPRRGCGGSFGADGHRRCRHGAGQVTIELVRRSARRDVAEVRHHDGLRGRVDQQRITADRAVRDPRPPQGQELPVQVIKRGVTDIGGVGIRQGRPGRRPVDEQRVPGRPGGSRLDDLGHGDARLARPQGEERLVLDLLKAGNGEAWSGVPVQQEPARLGEEPGIGRIPAVDLDPEATGRTGSVQLGGLVSRYPPDLPPVRAHVGRADAELGQQQLHITGRRQAER